MRKRLILSAVLALVMSGEAPAEGMAYNYLQGNLLANRLKSGGASDSGSGYGLEGAISNQMPFYGFFAFGKSGRFGFAGDGFQLINVSAGVGGHLSLAATLDLVGGISYENVQQRIHYAVLPDRNTSYGGLGYSAGLRGLFSEKLQWTAGLKYRQLDKLKTILSVKIGGRYYITPAFAVGADFTGQKYDKSSVDYTESIAAVTFRYEFSDNW